MINIIFVTMKRASESPLNRFNKSINRTDLSPRKSAQKPHTVYHEDKLKVLGGGCRYLLNLNLTLETALTVSKYAL